MIQFKSDAAPEVCCQFQLSVLKFLAGSKAILKLLLSALALSAGAFLQPEQRSSALTTHIKIDQHDYHFYLLA